MKSNLRRRVRSINGSNNRNDEGLEAKEGEASKKESVDIKSGHGINDAAETTIFNRSSPVDESNELTLSRVKTNSSDFDFSFVNPAQRPLPKDSVVPDATQQKYVSGFESAPAVTSFGSDPAAAVMPPKSSIGKGQTKYDLPDRRSTSNMTAERHDFVVVDARSAVEGGGSLETRGHDVSERTETTPKDVSDDEVDLLEDPGTKGSSHKGEEDREGELGGHGKFRDKIKPRSHILTRVERRCRCSRNAQHWDPIIYSHKRCWHVCKDNQNSN